MARENECCLQNSCLVDALQDNVNSVVNCYTDGGCFSGLLVSANEDCCKVITSTSRSSCCRSNCGNDFGKVTIIPINKITACTFCNTGL